MMTIKTNITECKGNFTDATAVSCASAWLTTFKNFDPTGFLAVSGTFNTRSCRFPKRTSRPRASIIGASNSTRSAFLAAKYGNKTLAESEVEDEAYLESEIDLELENEAEAEAELETDEEYDALFLAEIDIEDEADEFAEIDEVSEAEVDEEAEEESEEENPFGSNRTSRMRGKYGRRYTKKGRASRKIKKVINW